MFSSATDGEQFMFAQREGRMGRGKKRKEKKRAEIEFGLSSAHLRPNCKNSPLSFVFVSVPTTVSVPAKPRFST